MPEISQIREYMKKQLETDKSIRRIPVSAPTIEEALKEASVELGAPVKRLEYEVEDSGSPGAFGLGQRNCRLTVWIAVKEVKVEEFGGDIGGDFSFEESFESQPKDIDGEALVRLAPEGVLLKVTPPIGRGQRVGVKQAMALMKNRNAVTIDEEMVKNVVKQSDGEYIKVAEFDYNPMNDAAMTVDIIDFEMQATITAQAPGPGGTDLSMDSIIGALKNNSVIHGYIDDVIAEFVDHPKYNFPVTVAEGTKPKNGADAKIIYNFETDTDKVRLKESDGKVDFKELNKIQNVVEGQLLAKKVPAEDGEDGRTVTGKVLPAKPGADKVLGIGKNVKLSDDGLSIVAVTNGQVLLLGGKVNVEPVYIVQGDVNMKTGNITHLGTIIVKGNVEDGFVLKASGNIEIYGTVGKCKLDSEGNIIVHQGITGKSEGEIFSGRTVWSKFIENANVQVGENVVVTDGIINSQVDANKKVICMSHGKRAKIVGGRIRAAEEVIAETFGSLSGSETVIEVGYDPKSKARMAELAEEKEAMEKELEDLNLNIHTLAKQKKVRKKLPEDKEKFLRELLLSKKEKDDAMEKIDGEMKEIQEYLASLKSIGKVSASKRVYPGVKIYIKEAFLNVRNEFKATAFINENGNVKMTKYEEPEEDYSRSE
jgi:uncharacterized protein